MACRNANGRAANGRAANDRSTRGTIRVLGLAALCFVPTGCFNTPTGDVLFACDPKTAPECPDDYECRTDGCCHHVDSDAGKAVGACGFGAPDSDSFTGGDSATNATTGGNSATGDPSSTGGNLADRKQLSTVERESGRIDGTLATASTKR